MILLYLYPILWILNPVANIIFLILAIALTVMSSSYLTSLSGSKSKSRTFYNFFIPAMVFFGVTHIGFLTALATVKVEDGDIEVNVDMVNRRLGLK